MRSTIYPYVRDNKFTWHLRPYAHHLPPASQFWHSSVMYSVCLGLCAHGGGAEQMSSLSPLFDNISRGKFDNRSMDNAYAYYLKNPESRFFYVKVARSASYSAPHKPRSSVVTSQNLRRWHRARAEVLGCAFFVHDQSSGCFVFLHDFSLPKMLETKSTSTAKLRRSAESLHRLK